MTIFTDIHYGLVSGVNLQDGCMFQVFQVIYLVTCLVGFLEVVLLVVVLLAVVPLVAVHLVACLVVEVDDMVVPEGEKCKTLLSH